MKITRKEIDKLFKDHNNNIDIALSLYRKAFSDYDKIKTIEGYPAVSQETSLYLFNKFISFDKKHTPQVMAGGLWLNKGFKSSENNLLFGEIDITDCKLIYK